MNDEPTNDPASRSATSPAVRITGRRASHFTRVALLFAHELGVPYEFDRVEHLGGLDPAGFGGHPALKLPTLGVDGSPVFGTDAICRKLAVLAGRLDDPRIVLSRRVDSDLVRNAQELVWTAMTNQVPLIVGVSLAKLPAESHYFEKIRAGLRGTLGWLERHLPAVLDELPTPRDVSVFEVTLFSLVEHVAFFRTAPLDPLPNLRAFSASFAERESARHTPYVLDRPETGPSSASGA